MGSHAAKTNARLLTLACWLSLSCPSTADASIRVETQSVG